MIKNLIAASIISLAIAGAVFVVKNSPVADEQPLTKTNQPARINEIIQETPGLNRQRAFSASKPSRNLTEYFSNSFAQKIVEENPTGPTTLNGEGTLSMPDAKTLAAELILKAQKDFDPKSLRPTIEDSALSISGDNSPEALQQYLASFNQIVSAAADRIPPEIFTNPEQINMAHFSKLADAHRYGFEQFLKLKVPTKILAIHKKELELLGTKANIYQKLADTDKDPLAAILSISELKKLEKEFSTLEEEFSNLVKNI